MTHRFAVLCYGHDELLLHTRRLILREYFQVLAAASVEAVAAIACVEQMDLVLLYHSLSEGECDQMIALVGGLWPQAKVLILTAPNLDRASSQPHEEFAALDGPYSLMRKMREMLSGKPD